MKTIVWFRQDLRVSDNPALYEAARKGAVLPVYIHEALEQSSDRFPLGGASKWWLHHSLVALQKLLPGLLVFNGRASELIPGLVAEIGAQSVCWNRCYDPHSISRDTKIKAQLVAMGIDVKSFKSQLLFEPWELRTKTGAPYKMFTPFWNSLRSRLVEEPLKAPRSIKLVPYHGGGDVDQLGLLPKDPDWTNGWTKIWKVGEVAARERLSVFLKNGLQGYGYRRDRPDLDNVSRLSPHLHFGEISARQVWASVQHLMEANADLSGDGWKFLSEIAWRDFSAHLLYDFPDLPSRNWKQSFGRYPWRESEEDLRRWQTGQTGYPFVDAGMRELWATGYMHNRVRMVVASFLVKHLRLHWQHGENWFRDTLVDADLASNSASWQWVAGSGADAAPYFRIFNPIKQGEKFDPDGWYTRRWVPELKDLETKYLLAPFEAPRVALETAGVVLGKNYPKPIVDHRKARQAALDEYGLIQRA